MMGMGVGLLVAATIASRAARGDWLTSAAVVAFTGPLSLYAAYDVASLGRWPVWTWVLLAWAGREAFWGWASHPQDAMIGPTTAVADL